MVGWIRFTFQTASLVSFFVIRPRRGALETLHQVEAFASGPKASGHGAASSSECHGADTQNSITGVGHV
jgi:hypothetical protein